MGWNDPYESKYDFSEKFKGKSTRELLDSIPPDQKALLKGWFGDEETPRSEEWPEAPAYWLSKAAFAAIEEAFSTENLEELVAVIQERGSEVPREVPEISTTLYGEFLHLLSIRDVSVAKPRRSPHGIIYVFSRAQAEETQASLRQFVASATDELLSDPNVTALILYNDEPALVRKGLDHFSRGLDIPADYDALLLIGR